MTGGGFGGCTVSLVETCRASKQIGEKIAAAYRARKPASQPTVLTAGRRAGRTSSK